MRVLHINAGTETGGGRVHLVSLLSQENNKNVELLTFQQGIISQEAQELGITTKVLEQKSQFDLSILKPLKNYINAGKYDIIHTHGPRANLFVSLIRKYIDAKWLITVHSDPRLDFINAGFKGSVFSEINKRAIKKSDSIITVSRELKECLISQGYQSDKVHVVHNGIKFPKNTKDSKRENKKFTITHVGRFHPIKRHEYLLESLKKSEITEFKLNFIGDGELQENIKDLVVLLDMNENVEFFGQLDRNSINDILDKTDITILTSKSETFPLVLLESASRKVPFITTNVGDVHDLDPDRRYSWIVPVDDQEALIKSIKNAHKLWKQGGLHLRGEKIYSMLQNKYTLDAMSENTVKVYTEMLQGFQE